MKRAFSIYPVIFLAVTIALVAWLSVRRVKAATFTVTTAADNGDNVNPTPGSLRKAIIDANNSAGLDTISFNIAAAGVQTITLLAALPTITDPVIIDGYTQPLSNANTLAVGSDATLLIELNGTSAGAGVSGLTITAGGSTVRGLVINRFTSLGINLATIGGNTIEGCYIGTNAAGTAKLNNTSVGVLINGTPNNLIGGTTPAARNVLSGNLQGVQVNSIGATGNTVQGNYIGTDKTGTVALGNTPGDGIQVVSGASNNTIGGTAVGAGNVISGNAQDGVSLFGANNNSVQGNLIGTDATGTLDRGNTRIGVIIRSTSSGNTIGGTAPGARNVISGNNDAGIDIEETASNNTVQGNYIGTDVNGSADLGNSLSGIVVQSGPNNIIGGTTAAARNVVSGNNQFGIKLLSSTSAQILGNFIGTNAAGTAAIGNSFSGISVNALGSTIGGTTGTTPGGACTGACNLISGNIQSGIEIQGGSAVIQGNYIGTDVNGNADLGNSGAGITQSNSTGNIVGGTSAAARNVVSGNNSIGIQIGAGSNTVQGNYIGLDSAGTAALGNSSTGVSITSSGNTIGGTVAGAGNVISGHTTSPGVEIGNTVGNNTVQGNFIGTDSSGTLALGNQTGILLGNNSSSSLIGGATAGARNVISGNTTNGLFIGRPSTAQTFTSSNNTVQGNFIGTDASGTADLGNGGNGVVLRDSANNTIGGTTAGERNVISGNNASGIRLDKAALAGVTTGNSVRGNYIGTNAAGTGPLGNSLSGVLIDNSTTTNNTVGGTAVGQGNVIAFNGVGVSVTTSATGNAIRGNSILSNTGMGIDLDVIGVTANDDCDGDVASNNRQNFPVIISATNLTDAVRIEGTLNSTANTSFSLDFFVNPGCDPSGNGEGQTYIGSAIVMTGAAPNCIADFTGNNAITLPAASLAAGQRITATATDPSGNTSEFSACSGPTAIEFASFTATGFESGVLLEWQTGFEANNLGFNAYRETSGTREQVNPQMIAGSALVAGSGTVMRAGRSYSWWDKLAKGERVSYWLEDVDITGKSTLHGPFTSKSIGGPPPAHSQAALLSQIGEAQPIITAQAASLPSRKTPSKGSLIGHPESLASPASGPAVKLGVREDGWYRVTQSELLAAGFDPRTDPRNLQLSLEGVEQAFLVTGESDGRLDSTDVVEFYGKGLDWPSSDTHIYWLVAGKERGKRISISASHGEPGGAHCFSYTVERKERSIYFSALLNGEAENFFGRVVSSQPVEQSLPLQHLDTTSSAAEVEVALQGVTDLGGTEDHQVSVSLNGVFIGRMVFDGREHEVERFSIYGALLKDGENTVTLSGQSGSDVTLVDYVRISYDHTYAADNDELSLTTSVENGASQTIEGFSTPLIRVIDVSDPSAVQELAGQIESRKVASFAVTVDVSGAERSLLSFADSQIKRPASITANRPSSWRTANNGADIVMITGRELAAGLEPLRALRQRQGLSAAVVDVEDIYDEFNFGEKTSQSLKDFINYAASSWKKKPRFVLLAGDASFDTRNYLGFGDNDLVPTKLVDTVFMETASDEWLADFDNDGLAEVAVGRLPVRTAAETSKMVAKIVGYESLSPSEEVLLVSDESSGYNFEGASTRLMPLVPANLRVSRIDRGRMDPEAAKKTLMEAINRGQKILNYAGHGSVDLWSGSLLTGGDARELKNVEHLPFFVMMTCLNGYFQEPAMDSLGEALMKAEGGAVAVWASTGMTMPFDQWTMNEELYRVLFAGRSFNGQALTIGEAAKRAKGRISDIDIRRTWVLLGDPAMKLR